jgi:uncharacterized membrane protein (UPF0127 family)
MYETGFHFLYFRINFCILHNKKFLLFGLVVTTLVLVSLLLTTNFATIFTISFIRTNHSQQQQQQLAVAKISDNKSTTTTPSSSSPPEKPENDFFHLNGTQIPADRYLQAKVIVNNFELIADLAITNDQQIKGLDVKDQLKENEGMLFVEKQPAKYDFWMRGMKFPIDIIWLDSNRTVIHIEHNLQPCVSDLECPLHSPDKDALYILETVAGFSQKHNVETGTHMDFHLIR